MEHGPYQVKAGWQESVGAPLQVYVEEVVEEGYKVKADCFGRGTHSIWMSAWHTILPGAGFCAQAAMTSMARSEGVPGVTGISTARMVARLKRLNCASGSTAKGGQLH